MSNQVLQSGDLDRLGEALITLTQELWALKDRQRILEAALADAGVIADAAVDNFQPDAALSDALGRERTRFIDAVLGALLAERDSAEPA